MKAKKGSQFERAICERLSQWWAQDKNVTDLFWRTAGSGGRATTRRKSGKSTSGHAGDITNTSQEGFGLISKITLELKRGYPRANICAMLDKSSNAKHQEIELFIKQAITSAKESKTFPNWVVIYKKDRRETIILLPGKLFFRLGLGCLEWTRKLKFDSAVGVKKFSVIAVLLEEFFTNCHPDFVKRLKQE